MNNYPTILGISPLQKVRGEGAEEIAYTKIDHFILVDRITTEEFVHHASHAINLHTQANLPLIHKIQFKLVGKGTVKHSPEIFNIFYLLQQVQP